MKKILIAVALLGLSSTAAMAENNLSAACQNKSADGINRFEQRITPTGQKTSTGLDGEWDNKGLHESDNAIAASWVSAIKSGNTSDLCKTDNSGNWMPVTTPSGTGATKTDLDKETQDRKDADQKIVDDQKKVDDAQNVEIGKKADQAALDQEVKDRKDGDNDLSDKIDKNKEEQSVTDSAQNAQIGKKADQSDLNKEVSDRKAADDKLQTNINNESSTRASADAALSSRIDSNDSTLVQHDQRITSNTQRIGSVEGRVSNLEQSTNQRFSDVDKRMGENRKVASAGIAGAGAMANIPGLTQNGNFSVGAGIGGYDGEQAVAVGFNARVNQNVTTKVTVSTNTQSEVLWGAGVGVEW